MCDAMARLSRERSLGLYDGISRSTFLALERRGLVTIERREPTVRHGVRGMEGGRHRGRLIANWIVTASVGS